MQGLVEEGHSIVIAALMQWQGSGPGVVRPSSIVIAVLWVSLWFSNWVMAMFKRWRKRGDGNMGRGEKAGRIVWESSITEDIKLV
jgi:hypothetical protein